MKEIERTIKGLEKLTKSLIERKEIFEDDSDFDNTVKLERIIKILKKACNEIKLNNIVDQFSELVDNV